MPTVYVCEGCELGFTLGWYHFHQEVEGAMAATCLACRGCGTPYRLNHRGGRETDVLYTRGEPETMRAGEHGFHVVVGARLPERRVKEGYGFRIRRREDRWAPYEGISSQLTLGKIECVHCHRVGGVVSEWPRDERRCPRCGVEKLWDVWSYIT